MTYLTAEGTVSTPDGLTLAVQRHTSGDHGAANPAQESDGRPTVVAVHGYPDNSGIWGAMIPELLTFADVVTYDVRGTGKSDAPRERSGFLLPQLVADLDAVVTWAGEQASGPIHLLAHDWGSIQAWQAVTGTGAAAYVAGFTSISGPCLDHVERWVRRGLRRGSDHRGEVFRQLAHSAYIPFFKVRGLAEFAGATGVLARVMSNATDTGKTVPGFVRHRRDITNGLELYRQNMLTRRNAAAIGNGGEPRRTDVPVQVITPLDDAYVGPGLGACAREVMPDISVTPIEAGHWVIVSHPEEVADLVRSFATEKP